MISLLVALHTDNRSAQQPRQRELSQRLSQRQRVVLQPDVPTRLQAQVCELARRTRACHSQAQAGYGSMQSSTAAALALCPPASLQQCASISCAQRRLCC